MGQPWEEFGPSINQAIVDSPAPALATGWEKTACWINF